MDKPPPDNLGKRQYDLNERVNEAFKKNTSFDSVKDNPVDTDVDIFFKIDLAAKFRNVNFIIDILKTGVTLNAHRAIKKCPWLFTDEYSEIICPEYLHDNIFPETSMRVKRIILKTAAMKIRKEDRVLKFFEYCVKINMIDIALKCLLFTSEEFKLDLLKNQNKHPYNTIVHKKQTYIRFIIGQSFALLEEYMKMLPNNHDSTIRKFRYLYPVDNNKYLDLLEKYVEYDEYFFNFYRTKKFDHKLCDDVMKKYKLRVLAKPIFYLNTISEDILLRNITADDAKIIVSALLPQTADEFWESWFSHHQGKKFFALLPQNEIFTFLKNAFNEKYPEEEFEMIKSFYKQCYYDLMTAEQQEEWALNQIKSDKQVLGVGNDYLWYRFVNFEIAFEEIKAFIFVTKEADKRTDMLVTLIKSVRKDCELEKLFDYYYKRHINELQPHKQLFINEVITNQNVFEFNDACWESFYKILLSTELYNKDLDRRIDYPLEFYKTVVLFYHILNEKDMFDELMTFLLDYFYPNNDSGDNTIDMLTGKLNDEKRRFLFNYLHTFYTSKMSEYKNKPYTRSGHQKSQRYFYIIVKLMYIFNVYEETAVKQTKPQKQRKVRTISNTLSDQQLVRDLKKDKRLVSERLPTLKSRIENNTPIQMNNVIKKIKIYFPTDIANEMLSMFKELVIEKSEVSKLESKSIETCINGIFELGHVDTQLYLMRKFVPENPKIDFNVLDTRQLNIQKAICRFASKSLPPVPLNDLLTYMQGDYVRYCLHLFSIYIAALPPSSCVALVESLLNSPVSTQKHALRLAFECLGAESLINISKDIWKKSKNVSLRSIIYKALFNRIVVRNESELYEILISFTLDLHDDDEKDVFDLVGRDDLPKVFLADYKKASWRAIKGFKDKEPNIGRKIAVVNGIKNNLNDMEEEFLKSLIDEHLDTMFDEKKLHLNYSKEDIAALYKENWDLTVEVIFVLSINDLYSEKYVQLAQEIVKKCLHLWDETYSGKHIYQQCCWDFIENLDAVSLEYTDHSEYIVPLNEGILSVLQASLPPLKIYAEKWKIQLINCSRKAIQNHRGINNEDKESLVYEIALSFGKALGKLISEYIARDMYFRSFSEKMNMAIEKCVGDILMLISCKDEDNKKYRTTSSISISFSLVEYEILETYMVAMQLLPTECDVRWNDNYQIIIDKLKKFSHPEVQYGLHQKFLVT